MKKRIEVLERAGAIVIQPEVGMIGHAHFLEPTTSLRRGKTSLSRAGMPPLKWREKVTGRSVLAIDREERLYRELRELRAIVEHVEALLEERLIGSDEPLPDELEAIREYETEKEKGRIELTTLDNILKKRNDEIRDHPHQKSIKTAQQA